MMSMIPMSFLVITANYIYHSSSLSFFLTYPLNLKIHRCCSVGFGPLNPFFAVGILTFRLKCRMPWATNDVEEIKNEKLKLEHV
ncbi:uncharacterized protein LOC142642855 isoform X2 [Castanea sativa]|uniref:uncharacterized protein LOC142642855 isoform X2 n=1 Tax=Castanea sativa TaxID=21020 RepID=UPI003F64A3FB